MSKRVNAANNAERRNDGADDPHGGYECVGPTRGADDAAAVAARIGERLRIAHQIGAAVSTRSAYTRMISRNVAKCT